MTSVSVNSHLFPYEMKGQGAPLLFISGLGTNYPIWKPLADMFASHTTIATSSQLPFSQDIAEKDLYLKSHGDSIEQFISELQLESPCLIGHSTGAAIALAFAHYYPDRIKKLVLINPFMKIDFVRLVFVATLEKVMEKSLKEETIELLVPWIFSGIFLANEESVHAFVKESSTYFCLERTEDIKHLVNCLSKTDISSVLSKIKTPTLILSGDQDLFVSASDRAAITDAIPNAEMLTIPQAGHMAHWEQPEYCGKMIKKFLEE